MKIIFMSSVYDMAEYAELCEKSKIVLSLADHNLNYNIILGLENISKKSVQLVNHPPIASYPAFPQIVFKGRKWSHNKRSEDYQCGFINLPFLKQLSRTYTSYRKLKQILSKTKDDAVILMTYDLHPHICMAMRRIKRKHPEIYTCAVLPDIPIVMVEDGGPLVGKKAVVRAKTQMKYLQDFDAYVFVTEQMKEYVNVDEKKYTVVEGIYNSDEEPLDNNFGTKKIIFYAGMLSYAYKIDVLLDAFQKICRKYTDYELWLCGAGDAVDAIKEAANKNHCVKYFGYLSTEKLRMYQSNATVFVNPRQNIGRFTKFSFPSKTMEYLALGKPVVGYRLDGFPEEYEKYISYVEGNTSRELAEKLIEVCSLEERERIVIGQRNREFIIKEKNQNSQCEKIYNMLKSLTINV